MALKDILVPSALIPELEGIIKQEDFTKDKEEEIVIDGFKVVPLRTTWADDGFFAEGFRVDEKFFLKKEIGEALPDFRFKQLNLTYTLPNQVKGYHLHLNQDEVWFISPHTRAIIVAMDLRADKNGQIIRIVLKGNNNDILAVHFPRGVAHAVCPLVLGLFMPVAVSEEFDGTDEFRVDPNYKLGEDSWKIPNG